MIVLIALAGTAFYQWSTNDKIEFKLKKPDEPPTVTKVFSTKEIPQPVEEETIVEESSSSTQGTEQNSSETETSIIEDEIPTAEPIDDIPLAEPL